MIQSSKCFTRPEMDLVTSTLMKKPEMAMHTYTPSTGEAETREFLELIVQAAEPSWQWAASRFSGKTLSPETNNQTNK